MTSFDEQGRARWRTSAVALLALGVGICATVVVVLLACFVGDGGEVNPRRVARLSNSDPVAFAPRADVLRGTDLDDAAARVLRLEQFQFGKPYGGEEGVWVFSSDGQLVGALRVLWLERHLYPEDYVRRVGLHPGASITLVRNGADGTELSRERVRVEAALLQADRRIPRSAAEVADRKGELHLFRRRLELLNMDGIARICLPNSSGQWLLAQPGALSDDWLRANTNLSAHSRGYLLRVNSAVSAVLLAEIDQEQVLAEGTLLGTFRLEGDVLLLRPGAEIEITRLQQGRGTLLREALDPP